MNKLFWILLPLLALACSKQVGGVKPNAPFENTRWKLTALKGIANLPAADKDMFTRFYQAKAYAYAGCNNLVGAYTVQGDTLKVTGLASTKMACPQPLMDAEAKLSEALYNSDNFKIMGDKMQLQQGEAVLAEFEAVYLK